MFCCKCFTGIVINLWRHNIIMHFRITKPGLANTGVLNEIKYCDWNNVVCCVGFTSASSVQLHGNYSQWHWHSSGSDRPSHAICGYAGNIEPVMVSKSVSVLLSVMLSLWEWKIDNNRVQSFHMQLGHSIIYRVWNGMIRLPMLQSGEK